MDKTFRRFQFIKVQVFDCKKLTGIYVDPENASYCDIDGVLFSKDKTTLVRYPRAREVNEFGYYITPDSTTKIGTDAFAEVSQLGQWIVVLSDGVTEIGKQAFRETQELTIVIPNTVTKIGYNAISPIHASRENYVYFLGDVPKDYEEYAMDKSYTTNLDIYYIEGNEGWTSPTWTAPDGDVFDCESMTKEEWNDYADLCRENGIKMPYA